MRRKIQKSAHTDFSYFTQTLHLPDSLIKGLAHTLPGFEVKPFHNEGREDSKPYPEGLSEPINHILK